MKSQDAPKQNSARAEEIPISTDHISMVAPTRWPRILRTSRSHTAKRKSAPTEIIRQKISKKSVAAVYKTCSRDCKYPRADPKRRLAVF